MDVTAELELEEEEASRKRRRGWAEVMSALLLAAAGTASTVCGYYASYWNGNQLAQNGEASSRRVQAAKAASQAEALTQIDTQLFVAWSAAYVDGNERRRRWFEEHFRAEFRPAFEQWLALQPPQPGTPPTPFAMPSYRLAAAQRAAELNEEAEHAHLRAGYANERSDVYVRSTVFFGLSLFFVAIAQQFDKQKVRRGLVAMAAFVLLAGIVLLFPQPATPA